MIRPDCAEFRKLQDQVIKMGRAVAWARRSLDAATSFDKTDAERQVMLYLTLEEASMERMKVHDCAKHS